MDDFFIRMQAIYRNLWSSAFTTEAMMREAQKEWLDTFYRANLTAAQISEGIILCKQTYPKPPTPKEFLDILPRRLAIHRSAPRALPEPPERRQTRRERGRAEIRKLLDLMNQPTNQANKD